MLTSKYSKGMIFLCKTKCSNLENPGFHNYLVINERPDRGSIAKAQLMGITSMTNRNIENMEVPVKINESISFIVPYNVFSVMDTELEMKNYHGIISDSEYMSRNEFISFLLDIYRYKITGEDDSNIKERYRKYCEYFYKTNSDVPEYRDIKTTVSSTTSNASPSPSTPTVQKNYDETNPRVVAFQKKYFKEKGKGGHAKKKFFEAKDAREEEKQINAEISEALKPEIKTSNNTKVIFKSLVSLADIKIIDNAHRFINKWSDYELVVAYQLKKSFTLNELTSVSTRYTYFSSLSKMLIKVEKEIDTRGIDPNSFRFDPLKRPIEEWSNQELKAYNELMTTHEWDEEFQLEYTGFDDINECNVLCYNVKEEIKKRAI